MFSSNAIREEMLGILITGAETLAQTLGWIFYLLTQNDWALEKIKEEVQRDFPSSLYYTQRVISESLRLYPYIYHISRTSIQDDEMDGHKIPKGSSISLFVYGAHRHKEYWINPEKFDPERFHPQFVNSFPKEAYIPFGLGPHLCLGNQVALFLLPIVVSEICKKFHFSLDPKVPVKMKGNIALGTQNGIHIILRGLH
jgi:cytochrome P450